MKQIKPSIYLIEFNNQKEMASTFLRFQEYYESPKFRGKIFTLKEFKDWYRKENGKFTYYSDWSGFNFPDYVLNTFKNGDFKYLTFKEKKLLNKFKNIKSPFYVISSLKGDVGTLKHELAHANYYLNKLYKKKIDNILNTFNKKEIYLKLKELGYDKSVFKDETQAYLISGIESISKSSVKYKNQIQKLNKVFNES